MIKIIKSWNPSWQEGKYADLWSFVHILSAVFGGTFVHLIGFNQWEAWTTCLALAIGWEIIEWREDIFEHLVNRFLDVFLAVVGGFIGFILTPFVIDSYAWLVAICMIEGLFLVILTSIGWKKYKKYGRGV